MAVREPWLSGDDSGMVGIRGDVLAHQRTVMSKQGIGKSRQMDGWPELASQVLGKGVGAASLLKHS